MWYSVDSSTTLRIVTGTETPAPASEALFSGYRTRGMTDEVTDCERCGKPDLKGTVIVEVLDPDGNVTEVTYWGTTCAARYGKVKVSVVRAAARAAEQAQREAERAARAAEMDARNARYWALFGPWLVERFGMTIPKGTTSWPRNSATELRLAAHAQGLGRVSPFGAMQMFESVTKPWNEW